MDTKQPKRLLGGAQPHPGMRGSADHRAIGMTIKGNNEAGPADCAAGIDQMSRKGPTACKNSECAAVFRHRYPAWAAGLHAMCRRV